MGSMRFGKTSRYLSRGRRSIARRIAILSRWNSSNSRKRQSRPSWLVETRPAVTESSLIVALRSLARTQREGGEVDDRRRTVSDTWSVHRPSRGVVLIAASPTIVFFRLSSFTTARDDERILAGISRADFELRSAMRHGGWTTARSRYAGRMQIASQKVTRSCCMSRRRKSSVGAPRVPDLPDDY